VENGAMVTGEPGSRIVAKSGTWVTAWNRSTLIVKNG
jgi:hypothetical protein